MDKFCYLALCDSWGEGHMNSGESYYRRRAREELQAAARAVTPEGASRRRELAGIFPAKLTPVPGPATTLGVSFAAEMQAGRPLR